MPRHAAGRFAAMLLAALCVPAAAIAQQRSVTVTVPAGVGFHVADVSATTQGSPETTAVIFSKPNGFRKTEALRVSVQADASFFSGPGATRIPASNISWIASSSTGTPSSGTLTAGAYTQVYLGPDDLRPTSTGSVALSWRLAPVAAPGLRAGAHTLTVRWRFEAF